MAITLKTTETFDRWLLSLTDRQARARIDVRLTNVGKGLLGDVEPVGGGISELRINYGPGYRIYFAKQGEILILLLCGGDKSSQRRDIARAKALWQQQKE